jgi:hypothetical protein
MKKIIGSALLVGALLFGTAGVGHAAVTFDTTTGTGFSGKGDVQLAFGWNNRQLNANAASVSFRYVESTVKIQDCVNRERGTIISRTEDVVTTRGVSSSVDYDTRNNKKGDVTGFTLSGLGASSSLNSGGCLADEQPQGPAQETTTVALRAVHNSVAHTIWTPPAPAE